MKPLIFVLTLILFLSPVGAQYKMLEMSPPKAKKILKNQLARMDEVRKYKQLGYIGESETAFLDIREMKAIPKADQEKVKKVVADENKDRKNLYAVIAVHNKLNEKEKAMLIRSAFETYRNTDAKEMYYFENKKWQKKY